MLGVGTISSYDDYKLSLPKDKTLAAARSFVSTFIATTIATGGNFAVGAGLGGLAATASFVEALARPLINRLLNKSATDVRSNMGFGFFVKACVVVTLAAALAPATFVVSAFTSLVLTYVMDYLVNQRAEAANTYMLII